MLKFKTIDNLQKPADKRQKISAEIAHEIAILVRENIEFCNSQQDYDQEDIETLIERKTIESIQKNCNDGLLVYVENGNNEIVGCGLVIHRASKDRYESKMLHIRQDYRGQGLAQKICDMREDRLRQLNVDYIYIESLKFPSTLAFHGKRGFQTFQDGQKLHHTVLMRKKL